MNGVPTAYVYFATEADGALGETEDVPQRTQLLPACAETTPRETTVAAAAAHVVRDAPRSLLGEKPTRIDDESFSKRAAETLDRLEADIERILRDSGIIIQPYWRSVYRTARPNVHGLDMHQSFEAHLDKGRGPVATVLVQKGTLKPGQSIKLPSKRYYTVQSGDTLFAIARRFTLQAADLGLIVALATNGTLIDSQVAHRIQAAGIRAE